MGEVSFLLSFGAGFLSFFSPCILPLVPAYIMYISGVQDEKQWGNRRIIILRRTLGFVLGFTIIFVLMGTSATYLGKLFIRNKDIFAKISGSLIILFGLNMMGILKLSFLNIDKRIRSPKKTSGWFGSILMGMVFAAGWTPCFGPVLASILVYASGSDTVSQGIYLLLIYSLGMAIPFILTAISINIFSKFISSAEKYLKYMPKIGGFIMLIFGILVFFNKVINISRFLL